MLGQFVPALFQNLLGDLYSKCPANSRPGPKITAGSVGAKNFFSANGEGVPGGPESRDFHACRSLAFRWKGDSVRIVTVHLPRRKRKTQVAVSVISRLKSTKCRSVQDEMW